MVVRLVLTALLLTPAAHIPQVPHDHDRDTVQIVRRLFTVAEYMAMGEAGILGEDERIELLAGEIIKMAPIGNPTPLFATDALTMLLVPAWWGGPWCECRVPYSWTTTAHRSRILSC